jgi:hypothetical protein
MRRLKKTVLSTSTSQAQLTLRDTEGQNQGSGGEPEGVSESKEFAAEFDHDFSPKALVRAS